MSVLMLNQNGVVVVEPDSRFLPEVRDLYTSDKQDKSKPFYNAVITYAYYMYIAGGPYSHWGPAMRDSQVTSRHLSGMSSAKFYKSKKASTFIEFFKLSQMTILERTIEQLKKELEDTVSELNNIPKKKKIVVEVEVDIPSAENSTTMIKWPVKTEVEMDNTPEKLESYKLLDQLFASLDKLIKRNDEQRAKGKKEQTGRPIYDV